MDTNDGSGSVLTTSQCWELLRLQVVGRVSYCLDDEPEIFPVNYVVDGGTVVFRTAPGAKLTAMAAKPRVAFEVDSYDLDRSEAWSVVLSGRALPLVGTALVETAHLPLFAWQEGSKQHFVRLQADRVSGRRFRITAPSTADNPLLNVRHVTE